MGDDKKIIRVESCQGDLPLWSRIDAPVEELTGAGWEQVDITHLVGWLQSFPDTSSAFPMCLSENGNITCKFETPSSSEKDSYIERRTVCRPPFFLNSGVHKVIFDFVFRGKKFLVAIEEIENWLCKYKGEMVYIAPQSEAARGLASEGGRDFVLELLGAIVFKSTGQRLNPNTKMRGGNPRDKIGVAFVAPEEIASYGCRLTEAASRCFLYRR